MPVTKTKFLSSITHPDGTISTTLAAREYAFGVVAAPVDPVKKRASLQRTVDACRSEIVELTFLAEAQDVVIQPRYGGPVQPDLDDNGAHSYYKQVATFRGAARNPLLESPCDSVGMAREWGSEGPEPVLQVLIGLSRKRVEFLERCTEENLNLILSIDAGTAGLPGYRVLSWGVNLNRVQKTAVEYGGSVVPVD